MNSDDTNKQVEKFPVREGEGDDGSGIQAKPSLKGKNPGPNTSDTQANIHPEYTEEQPNRTAPGTTTNSE